MEKAGKTFDKNTEILDGLVEYFQNLHNEVDLTQKEVKLNERWIELTNKMLEANSNRFDWLQEREEGTSCENPKKEKPKKESTKKKSGCDNLSKAIKEIGARLEKLEKK